MPLLPRLLARLYHANNVYAIHFDLKISNASASSVIASLFAAHPEYKKNGNVIVMPSELITYRGISMLLNTIDAMRLLAHVDRSWEYFINLSGADYPLLDPVTIRTLLYANGQTGLNYFSFADRHTWASMAENRLSQLWFDEALSFHGPNDPSYNSSIHSDDDTHDGTTAKTTTRTAATAVAPSTAGYNLTRLKHIRNPLIDRHRYEVAHAEAWMINSRTFCDFVLTGDVPRKLLVAFAFAVDASEHYFASLVWNVPEFKRTIVPHSLRKIVWSHNGVASGQHPYMIDDVEPYSGAVVNRSSSGIGGFSAIGNDDGNGNGFVMGGNSVALNASSWGQQQEQEQQMQQDRKQLQTGGDNRNLNNNSGTSVSFGKTLDDVVIVTKPVNINTNTNKKNKKNNNNNLELGNFKYKFQTTLHQSALLFTRKFGEVDSGLMEWIDARSRDERVIAQATDHLLAKIETRQLRVSQL